MSTVMHDAHFSDLPVGLVQGALIQSAMQERHRNTSHFSHRWYITLLSSAPLYKSRISSVFLISAMMRSYHCSVTLEILAWKLGWIISTRTAWKHPWNISSWDMLAFRLTRVYSLWPRFVRIGPLQLSPYEPFSEKPTELALSLLNLALRKNVRSLPLPVKLLHLFESSKLPLYDVIKIVTAQRCIHERPG